MRIRRFFENLVKFFWK